ATSASSVNGNHGSTGGASWRHRGPRPYGRRDRRAGRAHRDHASLASTVGDPIAAEIHPHLAHAGRPRRRTVARATGGTREPPLAREGDEGAPFTFLAVARPFTSPVRRGPFESADGRRRQRDACHRWRRTTP